nr:hypothetical protein [Tanacetum cinerariifolium]
MEFTSEYDISEALHPKLPGPEDRIVDFPEGKSFIIIICYRRCQVRLKANPPLNDGDWSKKMHPKEALVITCEVPVE